MAPAAGSIKVGADKIENLRARGGRGGEQGQRGEGDSRGEGSDAVGT